MDSVLVLAAVSSLQCTILLLGLTIFLDIRAAARRRRLLRNLSSALKTACEPRIELVKQTQAA